MKLSFILSVCCIFATTCSATEETIPCGIVRVPSSSSSGIRARIFGGTDAYYGQVPWIVSLYENGMRTCGATIISRRWVITAAHCVEKRRFNSNRVFEYRLVAGDHFAQSRDEHEQSRTAVRVVDHPHYDHVTLENDVALLELDEELAYNDHVIPACLPERDEQPYPFTECQVSGWGYASPTLRPDILQVLTMPVFPHKHCEVLHHPQRGLVSKFTHRMICAGYMTGGKDTCKGDSGGPITCPRRRMHVTSRTRDSNDVIKHVVAGVTSWGRSCGEAGTLPVFTRVGSFRKWIDDVISTPPTVITDPCKFRGVAHQDRKSDVIASPGYYDGDDVSKSYPPNMDCAWRYDMSDYKAERVIVSIEDFELERAFNGVCTQDWLKIWTGPDYDQLVGTFCGEEIKSRMVIEKGANRILKIKFQFHSDFSVAKRGFHLSFVSQS